MNTIKVFAPASIGNVSCGFDVLGLAVQEPGDEVVMTLTNSNTVQIKSIEGGDGKLPMEADKNTASVAVLAYLKSIGSNQGVDITLHKNLPLGSGMGSSAASAVAAVVAINHLMSEPLKREQLLPFVMEAERIACGSAHPDNAAPSLLGGLILVRSVAPLDIVRIPTPKDLMCVMVHPHIEVRTKDARQVLRSSISLKDGVTQWGNTAALVAGMMHEDYDLIGRSLVDVVAEPLRSVLIPGFDQIKKSAIENGALGCGISGSGPTVFCLCKGKDNAQRAANVIQEKFNSMNLRNEAFVSPVNNLGARILS